MNPFQDAPKGATPRVHGERSETVNQRDTPRLLYLLTAGAAGLWLLALLLGR